MSDAVTYRKCWNCLTIRSASGGKFANSERECHDLMEPQAFYGDIFHLTFIIAFTLRQVIKGCTGPNCEAV